MCTICGSVSREETSIDQILQMMQIMEHRGPDSHGVWADGKVAKSETLRRLPSKTGGARQIIGHSRLSIVDKASAGQPYSGCDDRIHLVHNGEIYNYQELESLLIKGHKKTGESDSELIAHLIEESYRGDLTEAVQAVAPILDGMVTMAVTDGKSVVVLRDSIGKKPVYFSTKHSGTLFASEKKALPSPKRLNPGHMLVLEDDDHEIIEFDRLRLPPIDVVDFEEGVELYKTVFTQAISKRLTGLDEEYVGVIFSGGIDSVLVAQQLLNEGCKVRCYCAGTPDSGDVQAAEWAAKNLGLDLKVHVITPEEVEERLPEIIYAVEETGQLQVEVAFPMYFASEMAAADDLRIVFTGQGADEILGGYDWYRSVFDEGAVTLHRRMWHDFRLLYDETLEREDKLTMAHSLEQRAPYLDRKLVGESMRISPLLKVRGPDDRIRKWIHRRAAELLGVAPELAYRTKDPSQTGSGIHGIIEDIAKRRGIQPDAELVERNQKADKGNLFRYRGLRPTTYGSPAARTMLEQMTRVELVEPETQRQTA